MSAEVHTLLPEKEEIRKRVWDVLQASNAARFPGAWGRIPNFAGAARAAERVRTTELWQRAGVIKCNPDAPQLPLRKAALRDGKVVYMAVPRLRELECFIELDPARVGGDVGHAASIKGAFMYGRPVHPRDMPEIDLVVAGAVAVSRDGSRLGKGGGYSDLEYAILADLGKVGASTPVVTTVHPLQVHEEGLPMAVHDVPLDYVVTADDVIPCAGTYARPDGVQWDLIPRDRLDEIPILRELLSERSRGEPRPLRAP